MFFPCGGNPEGKGGSKGFRGIELATNKTSTAFLLTLHVYYKFIQNLLLQSNEKCFFRKLFNYQI